MLTLSKSGMITPALSSHKRSRPGFTIVELLIVVVIIAILAAITVVAYNGIQARARLGAIASTLSQYAKKLELYKVDNGQYQTLLTDVGLSNANGLTFQYTNDNVTPPGTYCITANSGTSSWYISNSSGGTQSGMCTGQNLLVWDKNDPSTNPVPLAVTDSSTFRTATASLRLNPGATGVPVRGNPYGGTAGITYTVNVWIKTDASWNGTGNNSKIRFGDGSTNALLNACSYPGVKLTWTQATCSYTTTVANPTVNISVGNDGTVGNVWVDDLSVSRT